VSTLGVPNSAEAQWNKLISAPLILAEAGEDVPATVSSVDPQPVTQTGIPSQESQVKAEAGWHLMNTSPKKRATDQTQGGSAAQSRSSSLSSLRSEGTTTFVPSDPNVQQLTLAECCLLAPDAVPIERCELALHELNVTVDQFLAIARENPLVNHFSVLDEASKKAKNSP